ncbi:MAG: peptidylprolyl isomerase [Thermoanaerobaculales bacterium]|jgi:parvulin-like peptidyl-prolyl isomerase|nr:peptidylprolyl isomerase [Thermoanaerobaculales bacterium]
MRADKVTTIAVALAAVLTAAAVRAERVVLETILVRVNDSIVTVEDFKVRLRQELSQVNPVPQGSDLRDFTKGLFDNMVDEMLLVERAEDRRIQVDDDAVTAAIDNLREQNDLLDDSAWRAALEASGMTEEALRARYRRTILLSRTVQSEIRPTEITEEEVRIKYEQEKALYKVPAKVEIEQLFFPIAENGADRDEVLRVARGLVARVGNGSDLRAEATLAGIEVQQLGAIPLADLRSDLRQALDGVPDGGFTEPMVTAGGVQVIHLVANIPEGFQSFEEVEEDIRRRMAASSYQEQSRELVEKLKDEYLVEIDQRQLDHILAMVETL